GEIGPRHWPDDRIRVERVAERPSLRRLDEPLQVLVMDGGIHIDALDAPAALARVEEGAIHEVLDRVGEVAVPPYIGRFLAAELQPQRGEGARGCPFDPPAALHRSGEGNVVDAA